LPGPMRSPLARSRRMQRRVSVMVPNPTLDNAIGERFQRSLLNGTPVDHVTKYKFLICAASVLGTGVRSDALAQLISSDYPSAPKSWCHDLSIRHYLSALRDNEIRDYADGRLSVVLRVHGLRGEVAVEARRLLRVLLLRFGAMPPDANRVFQQDWRCLVLCRLRISTTGTIMADTTKQVSAILSPNANGCFWHKLAP
jgi:hypothetical protein